jgi:hypothetical protein
MLGGSVTYWYGSGFADLSSDYRIRIWEAQKHMDPDSEHWCIYKLFKDQVIKKLQKQLKSRLLLLFWLDDGRIRIRSRIHTCD